MSGILLAAALALTLSACRSAEQPNVVPQDGGSNEASSPPTSSAEATAGSEQPPTPDTSPVPLDKLALSVKPVVTRGLESPLLLTAPNDQTARLFVVEQAGRIRIIADEVLLERPLLDISEKVSSGGERGLLGLALAPDFPQSGVFYVNYTNREGNTVIERYRAADPLDSNTSVKSAGVVLRIDQPYANHNGGGIAFGPDSNLWIGMGDGGSAGDPEGRAQNPRELLGKLLRIRVGPTGTYTIPSDNPANAAGADSELRPEIWSVGMRNPWRFTFDRDTNELWIGDVGQNAIEEIDFVARPLRARAEPLNFGWDLYEGTHPYPPGSNAAPKRGLTFPIVEYSHDLGTSVTGGYVYRGGASPALLGTYLYADYGSGRIWGLRRTDSDGTPLAKPENRQLRDTKYSIASFGEGAEGELYVVDLDGGVYRLSAR